MERLSYVITGHCTLQNTLIAVLVLTLAVFVGVLFFDSFETKVSEHLGVSEKSEILKFVGIAMGGILIALQAHASNRRAKAMEDRTVSAEQGLLQERMKNSIEHLGHGSESVRLGGAYELIHLAQDTEEEFQEAALDILCAHIRQTTGNSEYQERHALEPSAEVQSLLTMLFGYGGVEFSSQYTNLQGTWLNGAQLPNGRLQGVDLSGAHLQMVNLSEACLNGALMFDAHMEGAYLERAQLDGADLDRAQLLDADLGRARLRGADLSEAKLQLSNLSSAQLQGAILAGVRLQGAGLFQAQLQGVCGGRAPRKFADRMRIQTGKKTDLHDVIFAGSLSREQVDSFAKDLPDEGADKLRGKLQPHIGQPKRDELPAGYSEAVTGAYTEKEADKWIAEYEEAMSGIPEEES